MKQPKKPKFPKQPKSKNKEALARWASRCEAIKADYNKKYQAWKKENDAVQSLIAKGKKAKEIR